MSVISTLGKMTHIVLGTFYGASLQTRHLPIEIQLKKFIQNIIIQVGLLLTFHSFSHDKDNSAYFSDRFSLFLGSTVITYLFYRAIRPEQQQLLLDNRLGELGS
jgi:hypothetical protein